MLSEPGMDPDRYVVELQSDLDHDLIQLLVVVLEIVGY